MIELKHFISTGGVIFSVEDGGNAVPVTQWGDIEMIGCSRIIGWMQTDPENVFPSEYNICVSFTKISEISERISEEFHLPKLLNVHIHIFHQGIISQPQFKLSYKWMRDARGREIATSGRTGCFLLIGSEYHRLPEQLFRIAEGIDEINRLLPDKIHDKLLALRRIEEYLSQDTLRSITVDGYLSSTKIYFASALELNIRQTTDGVDFDPVLMRSHQRFDVEFCDDEIGFENILIPEDREKFVNLFRKYPDCQNNYSLGSGKYIVLDSNLQKALSVVRRLQDETLEKKLEFLKNPKAVLSDEGISDEMLESILSERIEGFGERLIKVIPWIKIDGQEWFPGENPVSGITVNGREMVLSSQEGGELVELISQAIQEDKPYIEYKNEKIPATVDMLSNVGEIFPIKPNNVKTILDKHDVVNKRNYVLYVKDNFSNIKYHRPRLEPRSNILPFELAPANLKSSLTKFPHQREGVQWMVDNYRSGVQGILLADDMGLGKTFQALTFLAWLRERMINREIVRRPLLIVAPTGLLKNWEKEHRDHLHTPGLGEFVAAYGAGLNRIRDNKSSDLLIKPLNIQKLKDADWILTTYETLSNHQTSFAGIHFGAVIFDEMQKIKTPNARVTEAAQTIKSDFLVGMTGTPIENRLADLWCLVDTLQPGRLGKLQDFSTQYEKDNSEEASAELRRELIESIDNIPPLMCRRMKGDTLKGLPEIVFHSNIVEMPKFQADAYKQVSDEVGNSNRQGRHLEALHRLRRLLLHPSDSYQEYNDNAFIKESARLSATFKILDEVYKQQEKAIIFIEFRKWHEADLLPSLIRRRYKLARDPMSITGQIKAKDRQDRVDLFQSEAGVFDVILLSPRAAGIGLTLTRANHVIHLSRWWNPAVEDQCTDRAYRIGQDKPVHVYYPMAKHPEFGENSFDFNLDKLLTKKRELSRNLLVPSAGGSDLIDLCISSTTKNYRSSCEKNIDDIRCMEHTQFEDWVATECRKVGLLVFKTQRSWDGGADIIIKNSQANIVAIIQCKQKDQGGQGFLPIDDLLRAKEAWVCDSSQVRLVAVTNASKFNNVVQAYVQQNDQIKLISADELPKVGELIKNII